MLMISGYFVLRYFLRKSEQKISLFLINLSKKLWFWLKAKVGVNQTSIPGNFVSNFSGTSTLLLCKIIFTFWGFLEIKDVKNWP